MEFYKLFHEIHRRTDWYSLYSWQRKVVMPEWYKERDEQFAKEFDKMMTHCLSFAEAMCGLGKYDKTSRAAIDSEDAE